MHKELLAWYDSAKRDLPWRRTSDPYAIWVSEVMLQQTQVATVIDYWNAWLRAFPTVQSLAEADEEKALALWQGLGYYRRCRLLLQGAKHVVEHGAPKSAEGWLAVPGIGPYTAGAIASIAQGEPAPIVDGNVERVFSRLQGDASESAELNRRAWKWARSSVHPTRPGDWNQALMELGATVCTPSRADCDGCPLNSKCAAFATGDPLQFPTKQPKVVVKQLSHVVWVPSFEGMLGSRQIPKDSWWEGMWEFPRLDVTRADSEDEPLALRELVGEGWVQFLGHVKHSVTNHRISIAAHLVRCERPSDNLVWRPYEEMTNIPMPSPQRKVFALASRQLM